MTRATDKPLRRIVDGASIGPLVVEITARTVRVRPLRTRNPHAVVEYPWGGLYTHGLILAADAAARKRKGQR
jgi:hypothetical protein